MSGTQSHSGNGEEGARNALAGYLYEIVGVHGVAVMEDGGLSPDTSGDLASIVRIAGSAVLMHERWGQDLATLPELTDPAASRGMLVQFKFSTRIPPRDLQPNELKEIARKLALSAGLARTQGHPIDHFGLVSNRALSPRSPALLEAARRGQTIPGCDDATRKVLAKLVPATQIRAGQFRDALLAFARGYGADDAEIARAVLYLIGRSALDVLGGGGARITRDGIAEALTGSAGARSLDRSDPEGVSQWMCDTLPRLEMRAVEREGMREFPALVATRALVVVSGPGGCGKTTSVIQWLKSEAEATGPRARFVQYLPADALEDEPIARGLRSWMDPAGGQWVPSDMKAEARLRTANPHADSPVLVLALDGADEPAPGAAWRRRVELLVKRFAERDRRLQRTGDVPTATLVLTCRTSKDLSEFWLSDAPGSPSLDEPFAMVEIGEFTDPEMWDALEGLEPAVRNQIQGSLPHPEHGVPTVSSAGASRSAISPIDLRTLRMLRHPVLWGAFVRLTPAQQNSVLAGDEASLGELARLFLARFALKVRDRDRVHGLEREDIRWCLRDVAHACGADPGMSHTRLAWQEAVQDWGPGRGIEKLHHEAEGYGLIERVEAPRWRWKHPFIHRYLAGLTRDMEDA